MKFEKLIAVKSGIESLRLSKFETIFFYWLNIVLPLMGLTLEINYCLLEKNDLTPRGEVHRIHRFKKRNSSESMNPFCWADPLNT